MQFEILSPAQAQQLWDGVVVLLGEDVWGGDSFGLLGDRPTSQIRSLLEWGDFKGELNETALLYPEGSALTKRLLLAGIGKPEKLTSDRLRQAAGKAATQLRETGAKRIAFLCPASDQAAHLAEGAALALYRDDRYKTEGLEKLKQVESLALIVPASDVSKVQKAIAATQSLTNSVIWARDLANMPGNDLNPVTLTEMALEMARDRGIKTQVIEGEELSRLGLNLLYAVGKGSQYSARLVILDYPGDRPDETPVALVGKGITFDTGGISIKPREKMEQMKDDMAGSAAVLGTLRTLAELKYPGRVVGLLAIAENMPSGKSYKPGDLLTAYNGRTVEIINTDAEGRIALADALAYADKHFQPRAMVDLATLTGACIVALGLHATGIMCADEALTAALRQAGDATGEKLWPLPLWEEYDELFEGNIADYINCNENSEGDAVAAAAFLRKFAGDRPWAHLDIAGTSWTDEALPYRPKGGTGVGVRLLVEWLLGQK